MQSKSERFIDWLMSYVDKDNGERIHHFLNISHLEQYLGLQTNLAIRENIYTREKRTKTVNDKEVPYYRHPRSLNDYMVEIEEIFGAFGFTAFDDTFQQTEKLYKILLETIEVFKDNNLDDEEAALLKKLRKFEKDLKQLKSEI